MKHDFNFKIVKGNKFQNYKVKSLFINFINQYSKKIIELYYNNDFIYEYANYFNHKKKSKNPILSLILINYNFKIIIEKIINKFFKNIKKNIKYIDISSNITNLINNSYILNTIKQSELVITDKDYIMEYSILNFISSIFICKHSKIKKNYYFNLKYIYIIDNIKKLKKALFNIKNISNNYNNKKFYEKNNIFTKIIF